MFECEDVKPPPGIAAQDGLDGAGNHNTDPGTDIADGADDAAIDNDIDGTGDVAIDDAANADDDDANDADDDDTDDDDNDEIAVSQNRSSNSFLRKKHGHIR